MAKGSMTGSDVSTQQANTSQKQKSTYKPNAYPMFRGAVGRANEISQTPYQPITRGVAGITPEQQLAIDNMNAAYGTVSPYMTSAAGHFENAANPLSAEDIDKYFNPYSKDVMANLKELYAQQDRDTTGKLTSQAGGVGADRIAVGQAENNRQQGLATGQTMAGIYQNALQAAQNQQGIEQASAYGLGNLGTAQLQAALSAAQAQFGAGQWEQMTEQQKLDAAYNQQMQEFGYPFAAESWYANLLGGLGGQMGGTTKGTATGTQTGAYNPADPSALSQIVGGIGVGASAGSELGWKPFASTPSGTTSGGGKGSMMYGGRIKGYAEGGSPLGDPGYVPSPSMNLPPLQPPAMNWMNMAPPSQPQTSGSGGKGSNIADTAMKALPMIMAMANRGGGVRGYAQGGSPSGGSGFGWSDLVNPDKGSWGAAAPFMGILPAMMASGKGYGPMAGGLGGMALQQFGGGYNPVTSQPMNQASQSGGSGIGMSPFAMMGNQIKNSEPMNILTGLARGKGGEVHKASGGPFSSTPGDLTPNWLTDLFTYHKPPAPQSPFEDYIKSQNSPAPTGVSNIEAPKDVAPMNQGVAAPQFEQPVDNALQGIQGPTGPMVKNWPEPPAAPAMPLAGPQPASTDTDVPPHDTLAPTQTLGHEDLGGQGNAPMGARSGLPPMPNQPGATGSWAKTIGEAYQPQQQGYFGRLARNPLFLMSMGILGGSSPYAGVNIGQGAMTGVNAMKEFQQLDYNRQAKALGDMLEAGRLDTENRQVDITAAQRPIQLLNAIDDYEYRSGDAAGAEKKRQRVYEQFPDVLGDAPGTKYGNTQSGEAAVPQGYKSYPVENTPYHTVLPEGADPERAVDWRSNVPDQATVEHYANPSGGIVPQKQQDRMKADSTQILKDAETKYEGGLEAKNNLDQLISHIHQEDPTGFLAPGSYQNERGGLYTALQTFKSMVSPEGQALVGQAIKDLEKAGNVEAIRKIQTQLGFNLARTLGTREAMQVIQQALNAVPGLGMTLAGQMNVFYGMKSGIDRNSDRKLFLGQWANNRYGSLVGAQDYFDNGVGRDSVYVHRSEALRDLDFKRMTSGAGPGNPAYEAAKTYIHDKLLIDPASVGYQ